MSEVISTVHVEQFLVEIFITNSCVHVVRRRANKRDMVCSDGTLGHILTVSLFAYRAVDELIRTHRAK